MDKKGCTLPPKKKIMVGRGTLVCASEEVPGKWANQSEEIFEHRATRIAHVVDPPHLLSYL